MRVVSIAWPPHVTSKFRKQLQSAILACNNIVRRRQGPGSIRRSCTFWVQVLHSRNSSILHEQSRKQKICTGTQFDRERVKKATRCFQMKFDLKFKFSFCRASLNNPDTKPSLQMTRNPSSTHNPNPIEHLRSSCTRLTISRANHAHDPTAARVFGKHAQPRQGGLIRPRASQGFAQTLPYTP